MKPKVPPKPQSCNRLEITVPVAVFCRIRPPDNLTDEVCAVPVPPNKVTGTLKLTPPVSSFAFRNGNAKEQLYRFQRVFPQETPQKVVYDDVAKPFVNDLLNGKNGLLFVYGITGSGKTYTMEGTRQDGGIIQRTVDVVFNSIRDYQARKYVFKPDKMNGFDIQSEADAMLDRQKLDVHAFMPRTPGRMITRFQNLQRKDVTSSSQESSERVPDSSKITSIDDDNVYSVFVTFIEIYNNYIYDLLEEFSENNMTKNLQSKILREDGRHNMYVHGCTEVEVRSPEEALEVLARGQKQRKVAHTRLNCESSRSHSVFTLRIVQAPLDGRGEEVIAEKSAVTISQLSLVDLAGSERNNRTKATGDRLKEAGNINNSLMALRQCIEILRENQKSGTYKKVPYRDSKLTHFFKNYFEGEGCVRMIVCVNPNLEDYDETLPVMKFAELAAEVQVHRPTPCVRYDLGLTPGRRRANQVFREARKRLHEEGINSQELNVVDITPVYSLGPDWPSVHLTAEAFEDSVQKLIVFLKKRISIKEKHKSDLDEYIYKVAKKVEAVENENTIYREKVRSLESSLNAAFRKLKEYEELLLTAGAANESLQRKFSDYNTLIDEYSRACVERDLAKAQGHIEKQRLKTRLKSKLELERDKMVKDMKSKLSEQKDQLKTQMIVTQVKALQGLIETSDEAFRITSSSCDGTLTHPKPTPVKPSRSDPKLNAFATPNLAGPAVSNPRHRRSLSQGANMWLDHRPKQVLDPGTILQPNMTRKSVRQLRSTDLLDDKNFSHYCLTTQNQDSEGELETKLYKGDILPTVGGGAQIVFQDVEILRQRDPLDVSFSIKRNCDGTMKADSKTLPSRCLKSNAENTPDPLLSNNAKRMRK